MDNKAPKAGHRPGDYGQKRNNIFAYGRYLTFFFLAEDTESLTK